MSSGSYFASGEWNFRCDLCFRSGKASDARRTWDGFMVCSRHKEVRNPQDFVRGVVDRQAPPWTRPEPAEDTFVLTCTQEGSSALPALAIPGCMLPSRLPYNLGGGFSFCTIQSVIPAAGTGTAGCATVGRT